MRLFLADLRISEVDTVDDNDDNNDDDDDNSVEVRQLSVQE